LCTDAYRVGATNCGKNETVEISDTTPQEGSDVDAFPCPPEWADSKRQLDEMRRQARIIANSAEYLAEDARNDPERTGEAARALSEWCKADLELLAHKLPNVVRHRRAEPPATLRNNRW